jgi:hypothetical protein
MSDVQELRLVLTVSEFDAAPVTTPWNDRNLRLEAPKGTQLTLFTALA